MRILKLLQDKKIILLSLLIILILLVGGLYFKLGKKPTARLSTTPVDASKLVKTKVNTELVVQITKDGFIPQTIRLKKGEVVKFINVDDKPHQVMSDPHPIHTLYPFLNTNEVLNKGESVTVIVEQGGTFTYHDHLDPLRYKGVIKIVDK